MIMRASCAGCYRFKWVKGISSCNGDLTGPLAMTICKPRQARKGATVAVSYVPGCGWLGCHPIFPPSFVNVCISLPLTVVTPSLLAAGTLVSISAIDRYNRALFLANRLPFE